MAENGIAFDISCRAVEKVTFESAQLFKNDYAVFCCFACKII